MLDAGECGDADSSEDCAAGEVGCGCEAHEAVFSPVRKVHELGRKAKCFFCLSAMSS